MSRGALARLGLWGLAGALALFIWLCPQGPAVLVDIPSGAGAGDTARLLKSQGVIRFPALFKVLAKASRLDRRLKPGRYALRASLSEPQALWWLAKGRSAYVRLVVPEGFMARQIAARLEEEKVTGAAAFMEYVRRNRMEGYLFPTTYFFSPALPADAVAHHMYAEFKRALEPEFKAPDAASSLSPDQVLILASIVEREARLREEMPMIAAVYLNRLKRRMRLEADPTVQYALGKESGEWKKGLRYADLRAASPYNTYLNFGLPPGPICSPGLAAVRAVLRPTRTQALYFVADNSGGHVFSDTLEEHNRAKSRAKRERRRARALGPGVP